MARAVAEVCLLSLKMLEAFVKALITFYTGISVVSSEVGDSPFFIYSCTLYTEAHKRLPDASRVCRAMYRLLLTMHSCNSSVIYIYMYHRIEIHLL